MSVVQPSQPGGGEGVRSSACDGVGSDEEDGSVLLLSFSLDAALASPCSEAGVASSGIWNSFNGFWYSAGSCCARK